MYLSSQPRKLLPVNAPLRLSVQKTGRLFKHTHDILAKCAFKLGDPARSYRHQFPEFPLEVILVRDDDICGFVHNQVSDLGIVGYNEVHEFRSRLGPSESTSLTIQAKLGFSHCRLALAVPYECDYGDLTWLNHKKIATSYPASLRAFLDEANLTADIITISGSVETMPSLGVADAICDLVATGSSLRQHDLQEIHTLFSSEAVLISSQPWPNTAKEQLAGRFCQRVEGVLKAGRSKYVMMNAPYDQVAAIRRIIPGMQEPTVIPLYEHSINPPHDKASPGQNYVAVHVVAAEPVFWSTIEQLKELGAQSILVVPIEKIID